MSVGIECQMKAMNMHTWANPPKHGGHFGRNDTRGHGRLRQNIYSACQYTSTYTDMHYEAYGLPAEPRDHACMTWAVKSHGRDATSNRNCNDFHSQVTTYRINPH